MDISSIFKGMKDAKGGGGGDYFPPGFKGRCRVLRFFPNQGFKEDPAVIAEMQVLTTNMPDQVKVDMTRSYYQGKLNDKEVRGTALNDICCFVAACLNIPLTDERRAEIESLMPQLVGEANPLQNREIIVETFNKKTRKGGDFTKHKFFPAPAEAA